MKDRKKLNWILAVSVLCIWGAVAYRLPGAWSDGSDGITSSRSSPRATGMAVRYVYKSNTRDPFHFSIQTHHASRNTPGTRSQWTPPSIQLAGILTNNKRKTALIESADGEVHFLCEGDTLHGVKVLRIEDHTVTYSYRHKRARWQLDNSRQ